MFHSGTFADGPAAMPTDLLDARILVVDDDSRILEATELVLKRRFRVVETLERPADLEHRLVQRDYDVILLDMNFSPGATSGEEGLHWLGSIRRLAPDAKAILMTAFAGVDVAVNAMRHGATDFVVKPWDNARLIATVSALPRASRSPTARCVGYGVVSKCSKRTPSPISTRSSATRPSFSSCSRRLARSPRQMRTYSSSARTAPARSSSPARSIVSRYAASSDSSASISARCPKRCSSQSCSAIAKERSPMPARIAPAASKSPRAERSFWTRSAI